MWSIDIGRVIPVHASLQIRYEQDLCELHQFKAVTNASKTREKIVSVKYCKRNISFPILALTRV